MTPSWMRFTNTVAWYGSTETFCTNLLLFCGFADHTYECAVSWFNFAFCFVTCTKQPNTLLLLCTKNWSSDVVSFLTADKKVSPYKRRLEIQLLFAFSCVTVLLIHRWLIAVWLSDCPLYSYVCWSHSAFPEKKLCGKWLLTCDCKILFKFVRVFRHLEYV